MSTILSNIMVVSALLFLGACKGSVVNRSVCIYDVCIDGIPDIQIETTIYDDLHVVDVLFSDGASHYRVTYGFGDYELLQEIDYCSQDYQVYPKEHGDIIFHRIFDLELCEGVTVKCVSGDRQNF
jgi:hypothetical protein